MTLTLSKIWAYVDFPLHIDKNTRESPEKVRVVNSETKRNPTKLVDILER